jgi:hypothetical protein
MPRKLTVEERIANKKASRKRALEKQKATRTVKEATISELEKRRHEMFLCVMRTLSSVQISNLTR